METLKAKSWPNSESRIKNSSSSINSSMCCHHTHNIWMILNSAAVLKNISRWPWNTSKVPTVRFKCVLVYVVCGNRVRYLLFSKERPAHQIRFYCCAIMHGAQCGISHNKLLFLEGDDYSRSSTRMLFTFIALLFQRVYRLNTSNHKRTSHVGWADWPMLMVGLAEACYGHTIERVRGTFIVPYRPNSRVHYQTDCLRSWFPYTKAMTTPPVCWIRHSLIEHAVASQTS